MTGTLGGQKRVSQSFDKVIGLGEYDVVGFNPDENKDGKEIKYTGESKDGNRTMRISIQLREKGTNRNETLNYFLEDKEIVSRDGVKKQYINKLGRTQYADDVKNLKEAFTSVPYHVARVGEPELVKFLDAFLDIERSVDFDLTLDWEALMKGDVRELTTLLKGDLPRSVLVVATVRTVSKLNEETGETEVKEYQQMYNRNVIPGYNMRYFNNHEYTWNEIERLREKDKASKESKTGYIKPYEKFLVDITDPEFGIKDAYHWGKNKPYVAEENVPATDETHIADDDDGY